jgi:hypothetical protein
VRLCLLALVVLLPVAVAAQGLGDAARREREKREKEPSGMTPAFTNADLKKAHAESEENGESSTSSEATPPPASAVDEEFRKEADREREKRALLEREWRARFAEARARVKEAEARGWRDVVRTEFYKGIPVQMRVKEFVETEEYRQAKKALADLEEEFRRTGLPPGWARE